MKRFIGAVLAVVGISGWVFGSAVTMDGPMTDGNAAVGQAYNKNFTLDTSQHDIDYLAVQVNYSSGTYSNVSFNDGVASTGSLTVVTYTALSTAAATAAVTITSNTALVGQTVFIAGVNIPITVDVNYSSNTACNIAAAITAQTVFASTCGVNGSSIVYSTAPVGATYNQYSIQSTSITAISSATFTGGQNNAVVTVNGVSLVANKDWYPITSAAQTATNLALAIVISSPTSGITAAAGAGGVVFATSTAVGTTRNYTITSSSEIALTVSTLVSSNVLTGLGTGIMTGGANASFVLGGQAIAAAAHGLPTGLLVYVSSSATTSTLFYSTAAVGGTATALASGSTYYVTSLGVNSIALATASVNAVLGQDVFWVSSQTKTTTDTYTLNVATTGATGSFGIWAGNDGVSFTQVGSTITAIGQVFPSTSTFIDTGLFDWKYYQLRVAAPTQGADSISAIVHGERR